MYLERIEIQNTGAIEQLKIDFPKNGDRPKPILIVGENGTGKSIFLSHLVNSLIVGKQEIFDDSEVEQGRVYKYRSPDYIKSGKKYSYSSVKFDFGVEVEECQLNSQKCNFDISLCNESNKKIFDQIPTNESSTFNSTFGNKADATSDFYKKQCCLYFPVNRFEEPAWLNIDHLKSKANYSELKRIERHSNRNIICTSPLKNNKNWLLDVIFDHQHFDIQIEHVPISFDNAPPIITTLLNGYNGKSTKIYDAVLQILKVILGESNNINLYAGNRKNRQISIVKDNNIWVPNLFQLSTGEIQLLNLFLSVLRDYDLSDGEFNDLHDVKGIVIIDEIDSHLHTSYQKEILPKLIASFPNVQFIITTHSTLFLMGMEQEFGDENFVIFNMPNGEIVTPSDFSEFNAAYESFKETTLHRKEIQKELEFHAKPIVFVEGDYDVRYLKKAAELLNKNDILQKFILKDGDGFGNLTKTWNSYDNPIAEIVPNKIILLYDCDIKTQNKDKGLIYRRVIPPISSNPISIGIENLFPPETIQKLENAKPQFIDSETEHIKQVRGKSQIIPASKSVNKDEKRNICDWLCEHGTIDDFFHFKTVFSIIEEIIDGQKTT